MKSLGGLVFLSLAACDHVLILDDLNDAVTPEHEVRAETAGVWKVGNTATVTVRLSQPGSNLPAPGRVAVRLDGAPLATAWTDDAGLAQLAIPVPRAEGDRVLTLWSKTRFNTRRDRISISIRPGHELLFSLDRPLAQPGQEIHLRALALRSDHRPDPGRDVAFEIHDSAGNRVLRETMPASEFGIAHATFRLADEVLLGDYVATARAGSVAAERPFQVKRYVFPRFRLELATEAAFVLPGDAVRGVLSASYVFGNPVAGAKVVLHADVFDGDVRPVRHSVAATDASGRCAFSLDAPPKGKLLRLTADVTDTATHTESTSLVVPIVRSPLLIHAAPTGALAPGLENEVIVVVLRADGRPVEAEVTCGRQTVRTDRRGWARLTVSGTPVEIRARDDEGHVDERVFHFPGRASVSIRPSLRAPKAGTTLTVEIRAAKDGPRRVVFRSEHHSIAVREVAVEDGKGALTVDVPADLDGPAAIECGDASTLLWIRGTRRLEVDVRPDKPVVRPGDELAIRFRVRDAAGLPVRAALGVGILDDALRGLVDLDPEADLAAFAAGGWALGHAARTLWKGEDEACEIAAALLLSGRSLEGTLVRFVSKGAP